MKWIMVMHHFSSNNGPKRLQSQQSPVMVVGVSLVILNTDNSILVETEFWNRLPVNEKYINIFFLVLWDGYFLFVCMMMLCKLNYQGRYQPSSIKGLNHTYDISFIELMRFLKKVVIRRKMWSDRSHSKKKKTNTIPRGARKAILFHCTLFFICIFMHHDRWNRLLLWKN